MKRFLLFLFIAFISYGCCNFCHVGCRPYRCNFPPTNKYALRQINYQGIVDVVYGWGAQVKKDKGIILCCSNVVFDKKIKIIRMEFKTQDILELQDARRMLVYIVEGLLNRVNNYMGVLGSLQNRPFGPQNLEIIIRFESFEGYFIDPAFNGRTALINGEVVYNDFKVYNTDNDPFGCKHEPYFLTKQLVEIDDRVNEPYTSDISRPMGFPTIRERYVPPQKLKY